MMITILRISSVYLITYIISLCGRKSSVQQAGGSQKPAAPPPVAAAGQAAGAPTLKAKSGDEEDDFKFQLNIKKTDNKKENDFDDDDEENPLVKLSMKKRKKMAGSMRQRANTARLNDAKAAKKSAASASAASAMEKEQDQEQDLFAGYGGSSKGVSCYQFELKKSARKQKSTRKLKQPAQQPAAAATPANKPIITSGEKARTSAEKQRAAAEKAAAVSEKTKHTQRTERTETTAHSEKKSRPVISPAPAEKMADSSSPGSISRAVSVTQVTEEAVREDSLKEKEHVELKPVVFSNSPMMNKR